MPSGNELNFFSLIYWFSDLCPGFKNYLLFQYNYDTEEEMNDTLPFSAGEKNY